jgi:hypothetical protein
MSAVLQPEVAPLDELTARRLTDKIRGTLAVAYELLGEAWAGRAWIPLGYASWDEYCAAEFSDARHVRLPVAQRRELVAAYRGRGMSERAISSGLGVSAGTVHSDVVAIDMQGAEVVSLDGRRRPSKTRDASRDASVAVSTPAAVTVADRTVQLVAATGARGMTVKELCRKAKVHHGQASGALSRLHRQGRIVRTTDYRDGCASYVVPTP